MPTRERLRSIGQRQGDYLTRRLGQDAREQRLAAGLSQVRLSSLIGVSRQWLADFEMGRLRVVDMRKVALDFAFLGHKLVANAYPAGDGFRDSGQLKLLGRLNGRLSSIWIRESEKAMSIAGDLRAWDEVLRGPTTIGVEAETRPSDLQRIQRSMHTKQRDSGVERILLLIAATDRNRALVRQHIGALRQTFPLDTRSTLAALSAGRDPGNNGLVLL